MKLRFVEEPNLSFFQNSVHVDIRAGLSTYGAFDKGSTAVPTPIRIGVIGTTATIDGVRDWLESCKNGVPSDEQKLKALRPSFPGMSQEVFGTSLEVSDTQTRTISRHELGAALKSVDQLPRIVEVFMDHAKDLAGKSGLHVLIVAPPPEVFDLGDAARGSGIEPPIDELQEPAPEQESPPPSVLNFHDLLRRGRLIFNFRARY